MTGTSSSVLEKASTFLKTHLQVIFVNLKSNGQGTQCVLLDCLNLSGLELEKSPFPG